MPMIRCPHCHLRQYAPATHATLPECVRCGRELAVRRAALIAPVIAAAERDGRSGSPWRAASGRS